MIRQTHTPWISRADYKRFGEPIGAPTFVRTKFDKRQFDPITAAVTAIGEVAAGTAAFSAVAGTIATGIGMAGLAMSAVGMVTGNQGLTKLGGVMGLAGGVMSLANSAGMFTAASGEVGMDTVSKTASDWINGGADTTSGVADGTAGASGGAAGGASGTTMDGFQTPQSWDTSLGTNSAPTGLTSSGNSVLNNTLPGNQVSTLTNTAGSSVTGDLGQSVTNMGQAGVTSPTAYADVSNSTFSLPDPRTATSADLASGAQKAADLAKSGDPSLVDKAVKWFNGLSDSQKLLVGQTAAGAAGGMFNAYSASQQMDFAKQKQATEQGWLQKQYQNANSPVRLGMINSPKVV